jgi:hypothetical protein
LGVVGVLLGVSPTGAALLGPSAYLCFDRTGTSGLAPAYTGSCGTADSPFAADANAGQFSYFHLETFEDHLFNTPGVTASAGGVTSVVFGPSIHDSVDADDGVIDGSGLNGDDFFSSGGATGMLFTFNAGTLGALPTSAGIVWTDGAGTITFEAFDENGASLGVLTGTHANGSFNGETDEDRFYGAVNAGGISALFISNASGGIEVDNLQYGRAGVRAAVPEPAALTLLGLGLVVFGLMRRKSAA